MLKRTAQLLFVFAAAMLPAWSLLHGVETTHKKGIYETPHIKWELPNAARKKRILVFSNYHNALGRYPAELEQRFNVEYTPVYWNYGPHLQWQYRGNPLLIGGDEGLARVEMLVRDGKFDAFVFWGANPAAVLSKSKTAYLLMVRQIARNGAGMVIVDASSDSRIFKEKNIVKDSSIPENSTELTSEFFKIGKGRGAVVARFDAKSLENRDITIRATRSVEYCEGWRDLYELRLGDVYSALKWALGEPAAKQNITFMDSKLSVTPSFKGESAKMELFISGEGDKYIIAKEKDVRPGEKLSFSVPRLVPGKYLAGMILREKGKVAAYGMKALDIKRVDKAPSVKLDRRSGRAGDKVTAALAWDGSKKAVLRLRDRYRRIIKEKSLEGGNASYTFIPDSTFGHLTTVELATLGKDGKDCDRVYTYFFKALERPDRFDVMAWGYGLFSLAAMDAEDLLADIGVNELVQAYKGPFSPAEILWISGPGTFFPLPEFRSEEKCWSNPDVLKALYEKYKKVDPPAKGSKHIMYMDEGPGQLGCLSSHCRKAYQEFLLKKYGNLEKLNAAWKSSYKDWKDVGVSGILPENIAADSKKYVQTAFHSPGFAHILKTWVMKNEAQWKRDSFINHEMGSLLNGNYTRWFDRQCFNNSVMIKCFETANKGLADSKHPYLTAGISGGGFIGAEMDMEKWALSQNTIMLYSNYKTFNPVTAFIDSIRKPTENYNAWTGYGKTPEPMISEVWTDLLSRPSYMPIYSVFSNPPNYYGILKPDLSRNIPDKEMLDSTYQIRNGVADALNRSQRIYDPVGILWSWEASCSNGLEGGDSYEHRGRAHTGAFRFADALGFMPRYQTVNRLKNGPDSIDRYKVLLLPRTDAIDGELAGMLKNFVKNGGTVIADIRPGIFTENLVLRKDGILDGCFGIKRSGVGPRKASTLNMPGSGKAKFELDGKVVATTGKALYHSPENIPAVIVNKYGKGKFVLLNFQFSSMPDFTSAAYDKIGVPPELRGLFAPLKPGFTVTDADEKLSPRFRKAEWKSGDLTYLYVHDDKINIPAGDYNVKSSEPLYMFHANISRQFPKSQVHKITVSAPHPALLVFSEKPLAALELFVDGAFKRGGRVNVVFKSGDSQKGIRGAVLTLEYNGKAFRGFRHVVMVSEKSGSVPFTVAYNEAPGKYTFVLTDTLSGGRTEKSFVLK